MWNSCAFHPWRAQDPSLVRKSCASSVDILYARAKNKALGKIERLRGVPGLAVADFGTRRRHSFLWQEYVVNAMAANLGSALTWNLERLPCQPGLGQLQTDIAPEIHHKGAKTHAQIPGQAYGLDRLGPLGSPWPEGYGRAVPRTSSECPGTAGHVSSFRGTVRGRPLRRVRLMFVSDVLRRRPPTTPRFRKSSAHGQAQQGRRLPLSEVDKVVASPHSAPY